MALLLDAVSWILLLAGVAVMVIGAFGIIRLPDVFSRMHGAGMIDTLGIGLIFAGLMVQAGWSLVTVKLLLILVFILYTSPTTTFALARACLNGKVDPLVELKDIPGDEPSKP